MADIISDTDALERIGEAAREHDSKVSLILHTSETGGELQRGLTSAAQQVHRATLGTIEFRESDTAPPPLVPALTINESGRDIVRYHTVPQGPEEWPFLETLAALAGLTGDSASGQDLGATGRSVCIEVFVAEGCPNCPHGVRAATELAVANESVSVSVVDASEFAEHASRVQVRSVPTFVVNGELTIIGVLPAEELANRIAEALGPDGENVVFESLMKSGRIADATAGLVAGKGLDAFAELWNKSTLEERIGLSLAAQNAVEEHREALDELVELILPSLEADDGALRGDTADLLGAIAHEKARSALERLLHDDHEDAADAAAEAIESIDERKAETGLEPADP